MFAGRVGREQLFIEKGGAVALRQVLSLPSLAGWRRIPFGLVAIGLVVVVAGVVGGIFAAGVFGGGEPPLDVTLFPTATPVTLTPSAQLPSSSAPVAAGVPPPGNTATPLPTASPIPSGPTPTPTPTPTAMPTPVPAGGLIAFESDRDGSSEIYTMNADGSNQTNVTQSPGAIDVLPAWSPDGAKIVFSRGRGDGTEIYVMNADGSNQVNLTNNSALILLRLGPRTELSSHSQLTATAILRYT